MLLIKSTLGIYNQLIRLLAGFTYTQLILSASAPGPHHPILYTLYLNTAIYILSMAITVQFPQEFPIRSTLILSILAHQEYLRLN